MTVLVATLVQPAMDNRCKLNQMSSRTWIALGSERAVRIRHHKGKEGRQCKRRELATFLIIFIS